MAVRHAPDVELYSAVYSALQLHSSRQRSREALYTVLTVYSPLYADPTAIPTLPQTFGLLVSLGWLLTSPSHALLLNQVLTSHPPSHSFIPSMPQELSAVPAAASSESGDDHLRVLGERCRRAAATQRIKVARKTN